MENDLAIVPVLNKIDLPAAQPEKFAEELANLVGCEPDDVMRVSAKTGLGVEASSTASSGTCRPRWASPTPPPAR